MTLKAPTWRAIRDALERRKYMIGFISALLVFLAWIVKDIAADLFKDATSDLARVIGERSQSDMLAEIANEQHNADRGLLGIQQIAEEQSEWLRDAFEDIRVRISTTRPSQDDDSYRMPQSMKEIIWAVNDLQSISEAEADWHC